MISITANKIIPAVNISFKSNPMGSIILVQKYVNSQCFCMIQNEFIIVKKLSLTHDADRENIGFRRFTGKRICL